VALETFGLSDRNASAIQAKGILHASGMAAISTLMIATLKPGDKILTHFSLYGGTDELVQKILPPLNYPCGDN
jgi:methionine-gamma-lyase